MNDFRLAILGGEPLFGRIRSTSNLVQPDADKFFKYAKVSYDKGWLSNNGPMVRELERRLCEIHGVDHCIATCNGLWALVLCIYCLKGENKNEILMPSLTYRRMGDIAAWLRAVPRYCDVDPLSLALSPEAVSRAINDNCGLILAAHPIVHVCDVEALEQISAQSGVPLLIDAVEAAYGTISGKAIGSFGAAECFSMHASKFLNGFEGGYITTNNVELAEQLRRMRAFGFYGPDKIVTFGMNAKQNEFHAAMALAALDDLDEQIARNRERYFEFRAGIEGLPGIDLIEYDNLEKRTYKNILIRLGEAWPFGRDDTVKILNAENMLARAYYSPPLHDKTSTYPTISEDMTHTNLLKNKLILMPSGDFLDLDDIRRITRFLWRLLQNAKWVKARIGAIE